MKKTHGKKNNLTVKGKRKTSRQKEKDSQQKEYNKPLAEQEPSSLRLRGKKNNADRPIFFLEKLKKNQNHL